MMNIVPCDNCGKEVYRFGQPSADVCSVIFCDVDCMEEYRRKSPEFIPMQQYLAQYTSKLKNAVRHAGVGKSGNPSDS